MKNSCWWIAVFLFPLVLGAQKVSPERLPAHKDSIFQLLLVGDSLQKVEQVSEIVKHPETYDTPVLFATSKVLYDLGRKDEAVFWFYTAQLQGLYAINLAADELRPFAKNKLYLYTTLFGESINRYAFEDYTNFKAILEEVYTYLLTDREDYNLLTLYVPIRDSVSFAAYSDSFQPQKEWKAIKRRTIEDFRQKVELKLK